jgi:hypothetical protein
MPVVNFLDKQWMNECRGLITLKMKTNRASPEPDSTPTRVPLKPKPCPMQTRPEPDPNPKKSDPAHL